MSKKVLTLLALLLVLVVALISTQGVQAQTLSPDQNLTQSTLDTLNPLKQYSTGVEEDLSTPGGIITRVLRFTFPIAGLILFVMLVWAGAEVIFKATDQKAIDAGKQRATTAIIGFVVLFAAYWGAQLLEVIFGLKIL